MKDISVMPKAEILAAIAGSKNVLILTHSRPDGDCLGAAFAIREYCIHLGKIADIANDSPLPFSYSFIPGAAEGYNVSHAAEYDLVIAVDCATNTRFANLDRVAAKAKSVIWIDHHMKDYGFGTINWVDPRASSTCEMIYKLLCTEYLTKEISSYLFMGLSTDTGHFMHSNVTIEVMEIAVELIKHGADCHEITTFLYKQRSREKTKLIAEAINAMRFYEDGKLSIIALTVDLLKSCNISSNDTEGIIDYALAVVGVEVAVCICEEKPHVYKVSLRSRNADVAAVAENYGGGGHKHAAGCQICGMFEDVLQGVVRTVKDTLWTE